MGSNLNAHRERIPLEQTSARGEVSEDGKVNEIEPFDSKATKSLTVNLKPGNYVLLCNLPGHYQRGIHTGFTVQ